MVSNFIARRRLVAPLAVLGVAALLFLARWGNATKIGGQGPAEPFRIAGNFYYVGANDIAAFLITGPGGHVVLDGGYPSTAPMIMASIASASSRALTMDGRTHSTRAVSSGLRFGANATSFETSAGW